MEFRIDEVGLQQALSYLHSLLPRLAPRRMNVLLYTFCRHSSGHASVVYTRGLVRALNSWL